MERSAIRGRRCSLYAAPGFHFVPSGLRKKERKKEAERRNALGTNLRTFRGAALPPFWGQLAFRRSTTALARGSVSSQRLSSGQASGDAVCAGVTRLRLSQSSDAPRMPVIVPAGMIPKPPESDADEAHARGNRSRSAVRCHRPASFTRARWRVVSQMGTPLSRKK